MSHEFFLHADVDADVDAFLKENNNLFPHTWQTTRDLLQWILREMGESVFLRKKKKIENK